MGTGNVIKNTEEFYDQRYSKGYMEEWPLEQKQRVFKLIRELNLPETGKVLDFGCGNGEFTSVLKQALPGGDVTGVDISSVAIENARKRYPECSFSLISELSSQNKEFDFLFTHHVLEHVSDIDSTWLEINKVLKDKAHVLHILPCGNTGSFEYMLCMLKRDGIEKNFCNRFYFEDKSHLRRLTSAQMNELASKYSFKSEFAYFSNHFYGAIDWISSARPETIWQIFNPQKSADMFSSLKLIGFLILFMFIKVMRFPANTIDYKIKSLKSYQYYFFLLIFLLIYPLSKLINIYLKYKTRIEWKNNRNEINGSEMYIYYKKIGSIQKGGF
ncbi:MAG: class I SAM-dependent methyltransferase [PVC group bacterium]|nr:class I SAM-dependent methyltransferase [PVC group bacterium]